MKKIKTLLVDDDYLVLQDLKKMVEWEALGFQIIDTAANGKQAQEQAEKNMPDLIVSDISMPVMDGFDFIEEIRKKNPRIYVILISSYASFDYARRALHNHIHSYILKNEMTAESLTKELLQAKKYIFQNESLQKEEMEMVLKKYFAAKSETQMSGPQIMRQKFVFFFVAEQIPLEKLKQHFEYILEAGTRLNREAKSTVEEISSDIYTFSQEEFMVVAMPGEIFGKPFSETSVSKVYWTLRDKIRKTEKAAVQIYVIPEKLSVKDGKKEFYHVLPWLHFFNSFPEYAKWDLSEFRGKQFVGVAQGFSYDCLKKSWNHPEIFIKEFRHYVDILFESMDADGIFMLYHNLFFQLEELSGHMVPFSDRNFFSGKREYMEFFEEIYEKIQQYRNRQGELGYAPWLAEAIHYMKDNYANSSLTVEQIAERVSLSASRFSVLFRQETNQTVNDYLTELRISQAVFLLENSNYKIYEIAEKVGYKSSQYFSQIFSQKTGYKPLHFRKKKP